MQRFLKVRTAISTCEADENKLLYLFFRTIRKSCTAILFSKINGFAMKKYFQFVVKFYAKIAFGP